MLGGETEARFTFLAVRRWFGWAAGQILLFDIGGGSLEIAAGSEELPDAAESVPLGAGRMTVQFLPDDPPGPDAIDALRAHAASVLQPVAERFASQPRPDHVVGSSKAIRSLAKLAGYPVPGWSSIERMVLPRRELKAWIPRLARIPAETRQELPGITADRTFQIVAARRRAAPGDEDDGCRRARGEPVGAARRRAAALHRVALVERALGVAQQRSRPAQSLSVTWSTMR